MLRRCALLFTIVSLPACVSYSDRLQAFRTSYGSGEFHAAEAEVDAVLAKETGVDARLLTQPRALSRLPEVSSDDGYLLLLEKGMARIGEDDADGAIDLFRRARNELDAHWRADAVDFMKSALIDDTQLDYAGADYEHVLVRVMLTLCDLLEGGQDAIAYSLQINEKQEAILGSSFGVEQGYAPRQHYRRVAIGAYLEGVIQEARLDPNEAARAYRRAVEYGCDATLVKDALERAEHGRYSAPGNGVIHVFFLSGRGPSLIETVHPPTDQAVALASIGITLATGHGAALAQAPVRVPAILVSDAAPRPLEVSVAGVAPAHGETLVDVNVVAEEQLEANLPWILARAMVRRTLKAVTIAAFEGHEKKHQNDGLATFLAVIASLVWTSTENADTRNWSSLPAEIQAARLEAPAGTCHLRVGDAMSADLRVTAGRDSYVVVLQPNLTRPGTIHVDSWSRVESAPREPSP